MPVMNFISSLLLGTPTDDDKPAADRPKVSDEDEETSAEQTPPRTTGTTTMPPRDEPDIALPPPPIPKASMIRATSHMGRARSLSRVYNQVPRGRPDYRTAQQDMIEYYAHLAMIETDTTRVKEEDRHLRDAMRGCTCRPYGRLYSRLQIASLCIAIGAHDCLVAQDDEETASAPDFKTESFWKDLREQLIIAKTYMLRKDANAAVPIVRDGYPVDDEDLPDEDDELDAVLEKHEMFQDSYQEVLLLIRVQEVLTSFCEKISSIEPDAEDIVKQLEAAVDSYENTLQELFLPNGVAQGADIGKEAKTHIPKELVGFLLPDLFKKPGDAVGLLLNDALAIMSKEECVYSHAQLKQKMKSVLTKWCESILDIPDLVQLGYGGVMAPIVAGDEDDVSSYGVEEDRLLTQKPVDGEEPIDAEPIPFRNRRDSRRTYFADEVNAQEGMPPTRHLPSKSPRMRNTKASKKSPTRSPSKEAPQSRRSGGEDEGSNFPGDDESFTQDPTALVNQHGAATPSPRSIQSPARKAMPIRGSDEEAAAAHGSAPNTPTSTQSSPRKRRRTNRQSGVEEDLWEDRNSPSFQKKRTYMDWTEDETKAVKEGYEMFGKKWALIKNNCRHRLSRRTNIQIKDKWRTMVKAGEILIQE